MRVALARYDPEYAKAYREKQRAKRDAARAGGKVVPPPKPKTPPPKAVVKPMPVAQAAQILQRDETLTSACAVAPALPVTDDVTWYDDSLTADLTPGENARFHASSTSGMSADALRRAGIKDEDRLQRIVKFNTLLGERFGSALNSVENTSVVGNASHIAYVRNGRILGVNPRKLTDAATAREEAKGWFPPGTGRFEDTLIHEHGHFFLQELQYTKWNSEAKRQAVSLRASRAAREAGAPPGVLGSTVSKYGGTDRYEAEADLWAFYHMGGSKRPPWVIKWGETYMRELGLDPTPLCVDLGTCR